MPQQCTTIKDHPDLNTFQKPEIPSDLASWGRDLFEFDGISGLVLGSGRAFAFSRPDTPGFRWRGGYLSTSFFPFVKQQKIQERKVREK